MKAPEDEQAIAARIDKIDQLLEEIVLDAVIGVLGKLAWRNQLITKQFRPWNCYRVDCKKRDLIPF
jgi:hypothetical protein